MNTEIFAEWFRRQEYKIYKSPSSYWYNQGLGALQAFPYHWIIQPDEKELLDILNHAGAITLRYSGPVQSQIGKISYHAIYDHKLYDFETLGKWARKNVRRGLGNCTIVPISFDRLAEEGFGLQVDTLSRQGRDLKLSPDEWKRRCLSAIDLPGFTAWGALVEGRLAASVITFEMNECGYMLYQQCHRDFLDLHVNNALSYIVTTELLSRPNITSILYGLHSLDAPASVDEFKFRMGYHAKPVRQRVVFNPIVTAFFNPLSYRLLKGLQSIRPRSPALAKAEGMVRFYLEGKRPLGEQDWPEVLQEQKENILREAEES